MVEALHLFQQGADLLAELGGVVFTRLRGEVQRRIEADLGHLQELAGDVGIGGERLLLNRLAGIEAGLHAVARTGAQEGRLAPAHPDGEHQPVEAVALRAVVQHRQQRILERTGHLVDRIGLADVQFSLELVDPDRFLAVLDLPADLVAGFSEDFQAEILQHGHHGGQGQRLAAAVELDPDPPLGIARHAVGARGQLGVFGQALHAGDVGERLGRLEAFAIAGRIAVQIARRRPAQRRVFARAGGVVELVLPGARQRDDAAFKLGRVRFRVIERVEADDEMDARQRTVAEIGIEGRQPPVERLADHLAGFGADLGIVPIARHEQQAGDETVELVAA